MYHNRNRFSFNKIFSNFKGLPKNERSLITWYYLWKLLPFILILLIGTVLIPFCRTTTYYFFVVTSTILLGTVWRIAASLAKLRINNLIIKIAETPNTYKLLDPALKTIVNDFYIDRLLNLKAKKGFLLSLEDIEEYQRLKSIDILRSQNWQYVRSEYKNIQPSSSIYQETNYF